MRRPLVASARASFGAMAMWRLEKRFAVITGHVRCGCHASTSSLRIVASRTDGQFFLHVVNTHRTRDQSCRLAVEGFVLESGKAFEIATDPQAEITAFENDPMQVREKAVALAEPYVFPAASVTALELTARRA